MSFRSGEESEAGMAPFIITLIVAMVITLIVALRIALFVTLLGTLFATLIVILTYGNPSSDPIAPLLLGLSGSYWMPAWRSSSAL